jgi:hypothetical protein
VWKPELTGAISAIYCSDVSAPREVPDWPVPDQDTTQHAAFGWNKVKSNETHFGSDNASQS